jgi:hypothetical protein
MEIHLRSFNQQAIESVMVDHLLARLWPRYPTGMREKRHCPTSSCTRKNFPESRRCIQC